MPAEIRKWEESSNYPAYWQNESQTEEDELAVNVLKSRRRWMIEVWCRPLGCNFRVHNPSSGPYPVQPWNALRRGPASWARVDRTRWDDLGNDHRIITLLSSNPQIHCPNSFASIFRRIGLNDAPPTSFFAIEISKR